MALIAPYRWAMTAPDNDHFGAKASKMENRDPF
jgi:hypothetical protein